VIDAKIREHYNLGGTPSELDIKAEKKTAKSKKDDAE
jgi:hypothetical protein